MVLGGAVIALLLVGLCATVLNQSRQDAFDRARETSRNVALIAERDIERNFEIYALSLQAVVDGLDRAASAEYLGSMLVLDAAGNIVIDSGGDVPRKGNFADRRYFTIQSDNPNAGLYISDPFRSRLRQSSPGIALSRRLSHPDGTFAGIVLIAVNLEYFHHLFAGLSLGPRGSAALIGKYRWVVERTHSWLHNFRGLRTRFDRRADIHEAFLKLSCSLVCWNIVRHADQSFELTSYNYAYGH